MVKIVVRLSVICLVLLCLLSVSYAVNLEEKFQRGYSQKDLYDELSQIFNDFRVSWAHFYDGKTNGAFLVETDQHYTLTLKSAFVTLVETPDAGTTLTVTLYNHSEAITDTITFDSASVTDVTSVGTTRAFTVQVNNGLEETSGLSVVIGGTTTTDGEVVINTEWRGSP